MGIKNEKLAELGKLLPKEEVDCHMKIYELVYDKKNEDYDEIDIK